MAKFEVRWPDCPYFKPWLCVRPQLDSEFKYDSYRMYFKRLSSASEPLKLEMLDVFVDFLLGLGLEHTHWPPR